MPSENILHIMPTINRHFIALPIQIVFQALLKVTVYKYQVILKYLRLHYNTWLRKYLSLFPAHPFGIWLKICENLGYNELHYNVSTHIQS